MLKAFKIPIGWKDLIKRTGREVWADNCLNLAAQLAYYFFLALFPALLFLVSIITFVPIEGLREMVTSALGRVAPGEVIVIIQDQIDKIAQSKNGGLLTLGMLGTIWSTSSGVNAIIDTLNQAYDIQEARPWWKVKLLAIGLTIALAVFIVISFVLVLVGPKIGETIASTFFLGEAFVWAWNILQWPVVFAFVALAVAIIYYFAPDAEQEWIWITPGSVVATTLWVLISLGFKFYVSHFENYNATYGAIGGVIVLMLWFYLSALAVLVGAELNAEIEHASPYGKDPGEKQISEKKKLGVVAGRDHQDHVGAATLKPALVTANCDVDTGLPTVSVTPPSRLSDWLLSVLVIGESAALAYVKLRGRLTRTQSKLDA
jgi:membrane protein